MSFNERKFLNKVMQRRLEYLKFFILFFMPCGFLCQAHEADPFSVSISLKTNGIYEASIAVDLEALLATGAGPGQVLKDDRQKILAMSDAERMRRLNEIKSNLIKTIVLKIDGQQVVPEVSFPELEKSAELPSLPLSLVKFKGAIPKMAREFTLSCSPSWGPALITIRQEGNDREFHGLVGWGKTAPPFSLTHKHSPSFRTSNIAHYVFLGFEHIIPKGLDHILFVLGLYLLGISLSALLWQVTTFTVAHSLTLALSLYGVFSLPSPVVEPLISLSIVYVAIENVITMKLKLWRLFLIFGFGLLHGLGFAGVLSEFGIPGKDLITALAGFNIGVELGQLTVILAAFLITVWFRKKSWYRTRAVIPASALIALIALYWTLDRI